MAQRRGIGFRAQLCGLVGGALLRRGSDGNGFGTALRGYPVAGREGGGGIRLTALQRCVSRLAGNRCQQRRLTRGFGFLAHTALARPRRADVLRAAPELADASFNYEFASRFRDSIASGRPMSRGARARAVAEALNPPVPSADLPTGPTLHGRPGGPPPEIPGSDFKTIAPMPYDEREQTDPGRGATPRRRG